MMMARLFVLLLLLPLSLGAAETLETTHCPVVLAPRKEVTLSSRIQTTAIRVHKELGQEFAKGDVLLQLESAIYLARAERARAALATAEAELKTIEQLHRDQSRSLIDLLAARRNVAQTRSERVLAEQALDSCTIKAPYPGRVVKVHVQEHAQVQPGDALISIVDDRVLRAQFLLPAKLADRIHIGQKITIELTEQSRTVGGRITHIGATIDAASSTIEVYAEVENHKEHIRAGTVGQLMLAQLEAAPNE